MATQNWAKLWAYHLAYRQMMGDGPKNVLLSPMDIALLTSSYITSDTDLCLKPLNSAWNTDYCRNYGLHMFGKLILYSKCPQLISKSKLWKYVENSLGKLLVFICLETIMNPSNIVQFSPNMRNMQDMSDLNLKISRMGWFYVGHFVWDNVMYGPIFF